MAHYQQRLSMALHLDYYRLQPRYHVKKALSSGIPISDLIHLSPLELLRELFLNLFVGHAIASTGKELV